MDKRVIEYLTLELDLIYSNEDYFISIFHENEEIILLENFAFSERGLTYHSCTSEFDHRLCEITYKAYNQFKELLNV